MNSVLIVGAKSDIAKAAARKYADNGYDLYLAARMSSELEGFANDVRLRTQRKVDCVELDILDYDSHERMYASLGAIPSGVIVAVGYLGDQEKAQSDFMESQRIIDTNYTGVVSFLNVIADSFERRHDGFIVAISSVAGDRGRKGNYIYGSAKAGLSAYLSGLRNRLYSSGVHVLTVKPGFVATRMTQGMDLPVRLTAQPEDVAEDIYRAQRNRKDVIYTKWIWRWLMLIIRNIPEGKFKGMSI